MFRLFVFPMFRLFLHIHQQILQEVRREEELKVPDGPSRYMPTSPEFLEILEERALKQPPAKKPVIVVKAVKVVKKTKNYFHSLPRF